MAIVANPKNFKIPNWFLNRQKDFKDGSFSQITSSALDSKLREDLERLKKIRYTQHSIAAIADISAFEVIPAGYGSHRPVLRHCKEYHVILCICYSCVPFE